MMMRLGLCVSAIFALLASGCAVPEAAPRDSRLDLPPVSARAYDGPAPNIEIRPATEVGEIGRIVEVTLTVPSGGHRLTLDHGDVVNGEAMLYLTLEQPRHDEAVSMALETLRAEFETDRRFDVAKVHVRSHRRGEARPREYHFAGDRRLE